MNNKDNNVYVRDILECVDRVNTYIAGFDYEHFVRTRLVIDAVIRNIEVIGEACNNLSRDFRSCHPQVEWRRIIATRNVLIHGYAQVDIEIVWNIAKIELPKLKTQIEKIVGGGQAEEVE